MLNRQQGILVGFGALALLLLFCFGEQRKPFDPNAPSTAMPAGRQGQTAQTPQTPIPRHIPDIDMTKLIENIKKKLSNNQRAQMEQAEKKAQDTTANITTRTKALEALATEWDQARYPEVSAYYYQRIAQNDSSAQRWLQAADRLSIAFKIADDTSMQQYMLDQAVKAYQKTIAIDSTQTEARIGLASLYIDGYADQTNMVMQGVFMLRDVVAKDSTNINANLVLARAAITSGQYDKAIDRLQRLIKQYPDNSEAYYYLGEAYSAVGEKENAINALKECKKRTKNPTFVRELDNIINKLLNT